MAESDSSKINTETLKLMSDMSMSLRAAMNLATETIEETFGDFKKKINTILDKKIEENSKSTPAAAPAIKTPSNRASYMSPEARFLKQISESLPKKGILGSILDAFKAKKKDSKMPDPGKGGGLFDSLYGGALGKVVAFLAGLAALWVGLTQDTSFTGALKILGKWLVLSPIKAAMEIGKRALKFADNIAKILLPDTIYKFFDDALGALAKMFKGFIQPLRKAFFGGIKGLFGKGAMKFALKLVGKGGLLALRAIPILGSLIDFGFAIHRFKKGDYIGGLIDLAAGIVGLEPVVGTWIAMGLNVLNMILDAKGGGAKGRAESGANQSFAKLFKWKNLKKLLFFSPIGPLLSFGSGLLKLMQGGTLVEAMDEMASFIPFLGTIKEFLGLSPDASIGQAVMDIGGKIKDFIVDGLDFMFIKPFKFLKDKTVSLINGMIEGLSNAYTKAKDLIYDNTIGLPGRLYKKIVGSSPGPLNDIETAIGSGYSKASTNIQESIMDQTKRMSASVKDSFEKAGNRTDQFLEDNISKKTLAGKTFSKLVGPIMKGALGALDIGDKIVKYLANFLAELLHNKPIPVRIVSDVNKNIETANNVSLSWYEMISNSLSLATNRLILIHREIVDYAKNQAKRVSDATTRSLYINDDKPELQVASPSLDGISFNNNIAAAFAGGTDIGEMIREGIGRIDVGNAKPINISLDSSFDVLVSIQTNTFNLLQTKLDQLIEKTSLNTGPPVDDTPNVIPSLPGPDYSETVNPATRMRQQADF